MLLPIWDGSTSFRWSRAWLKVNLASLVLDGPRAWLKVNMVPLVLDSPRAGLNGNLVPPVTGCV